jgi:hypothetical protein
MSQQKRLIVRDCANRQFLQGQYCPKYAKMILCNLCCSWRFFFWWKTLQSQYIDFDVVAQMPGFDLIYLCKLWFEWATYRFWNFLGLQIFQNTRCDRLQFDGGFIWVIRNRVFWRLLIILGLTGCLRIFFFIYTTSWNTLLYFVRYFSPPNRLDLRVLPFTGIHNIATLP